MWDKKKIAAYTKYLTDQERAVLEALSYGIDTLDKVKWFVSRKLDGNVDPEYVTAIWTQNMDAPKVLEDVI